MSVFRRISKAYRFARGNASKNTRIGPNDPRRISPQRTYYFGGLDLPYSAAPLQHFLLGTTGSGKTLQMRMSLLSVLLPAVRENRDARFVIADVKREDLGFLTQRGVPLDKITITLPFDERCSGWDLWRDTPSRDVALQIASLLIPESNDANRYFPDAARDLLYMVICLFVDRKVPWELADLLNAFRSLKSLSHVLSHSEEGVEILETYLGGDKETGMSVFSTARTHLSKYEAAAALWKRASKRFSLTEFMSQRGQTLLLGNYQTATFAVGALNRLLLQRLTELTLGLPDVDEQKESDPYRIFFFLDELQRIGAGQKLTFLSDLMTGSRSRGASCFLASQGVEALRCLYTEDESETLISMAGSIGLLRVAGICSPEIASKIFGEHEIVERLESSSTAHAEHTTHTQGWSESIRQTPLFLPGYFRTLSSPTPGRPLSGVFSCSVLGANPYVMELPSAEATERLNATLNPGDFEAGLKQPNFVPWKNPSLMKLEPFQQADYTRLKLNPPSKKEGLDAL